LIFPGQASVNMETNANMFTKRAFVCLVAVRPAPHSARFVFRPVEGAKSARETLRDDAESRQTFGKRAKPVETAADVAAEETTRKLSPIVNVESMLDRYYRRLYVADVGGTAGWDQYVHVHSNRVTVIGVASHHTLVTSSATPVSVQFVAGRDRVAEVKVRVWKIRHLFVLLE
jgi:hypothetical protein